MCVIEAPITEGCPTAFGATTMDTKSLPNILGWN